MGNPYPAPWLHLSENLPCYVLAQGADGVHQVQVTAFQSVRKAAPWNAMARGGSQEVVDSPMAAALAASKAGANPWPAPRAIVQCACAGVKHSGFMV